MKIVSTNQLWSRERNLTGGRIKSILGLLAQVIPLASITENERMQLKVIKNDVKVVVDRWKSRNERSKKLFINRRMCRLKREDNHG